MRIASPPHAHHHSPCYLTPIAIYIFRWYNYSPDWQSLLIAHEQGVNTVYKHHVKACLALILAGLVFSGLVASFDPFDTDEMFGTWLVLAGFGTAGTFWGLKIGRAHV